MKPFADLTAIGQTRRLRKLAFNALAEYDLPVRRLRLLTYHFNAIFRVDTQDGRKLVLRINLPGNRTIGNIRAEAQWLAALAADTDLVIPEPLTNRAGELVTTASAAGVPEPRHCVVFGWVSGSDLRIRMTPENYRKVGAFTTVLHEHAESWNPPEPLGLPTHRGIFPLFDTPKPYWESGARPELITPARRDFFAAAAGMVQTELDRLYASAGEPIILHADLHQGNIRLDHGRMRVLDFDDCLLGHPVQDIGITFYYLLGHPEVKALRAAYRDGYTARRPWPETHPGQIEAIIAGRGLLLCQFLFHSDNPEYQGALPGFLDRAEERLRGYMDGVS